MEGKSVIIKKVRKKGHGGAHGGSWKVAYADFVTAMMAFFLLLWLISMVSPDKKAKISQYFRYFSVFDKSGSTLVEMYRVQSPVVGTTPVPDLVSQDEIKEIAAHAIAQFQQKMDEELRSRLGEFKDQIAIEQFDGGVRLELMETEGHPMFPSGGNELTPEGKRILQVVAENLQKNKTKIAIEGHTDAKGFASGRYSNWELSTDRASAARKELEKNGLATDRLVRVSGFAATQPLVKDNAQDPKNRRISILLFGDTSSINVGTLQPVQGQPGGQSPVKGKIQKGNFRFDPVEQYLKVR